MVPAVPALVVPTMADVAVDVYVALGAPEMRDPVLQTTVDVPSPVAQVASARRAFLTSDVVPMSAASFAVDVAPTAALRPDPAPATPVALPVVPAAPVALAVPVVGP